jgi:hypothetical protein
MARTQNKTRLIVSIVVVVVALITVGGIGFLKNSSKPAPTPTADTSKQAAITNDASNTKSDTTDPAKTTTPSTVADPDTLASVDVEPLGVTVFYAKGTPGFEFAIKKTASQTQYVEFTSSDLVGTKCTDDNGLFASIIKNPSSNEDQSTITQTVKVGNDSYGLSLAGKGCTSDADLLAQYQAAFTSGFSSLKAL